MRFDVFSRSFTFSTILGLFLFITIDSSAQKNTERDSVKAGNTSIKLNTPQTLTPANNIKLPDIEVDSSNVRILDRKTESEPPPKKGDIVKKSTTPENSLAAELGNESSKTIIEWRPFFNANGVRGIRIPAVAISHDRTVLVFAETTGVEAGPNGTRIVAMNTCTWEPMKVFHVPYLINRLEFIPSTHSIAVNILKQEKLNQKDSIGVIDLDSEKISNLIALPDKTQITSLCASQDKIFVAIKGSNDILAYATEKEENNPIKMTCEEPVSALAITPDNLFVAGISSKHLTLFKLSDCKKYETNTIELPWMPVQLVFLDSGKNYFLSPSALEDASPILVRDGRKIPFDGRSGGYAIVTKDKKNVLVGYKVKGLIERIDAVSADVLERTVLSEIRPQTIGEPLHVFYLDNRNFIFVLDTNGNGYVAARSEGENRRRKAVIFTAKK